MLCRSRAALTYAEAQSRLDDPRLHDEVSGVSTAALAPHVPSPGTALGGSFQAMIHRRDCCKLTPGQRLQDGGFGARLCTRKGHVCLGRAGLARMPRQSRADAGAIAESTAVSFVEQLTKQMHSFDTAEFVLGRQVTRACARLGCGMRPMAGGAPAQAPWQDIL